MQQQQGGLQIPKNSNLYLFLKRMIKLIHLPISFDIVN